MLTKIQVKKSESKELASQMKKFQQQQEEIAKPLKKEYLPDPKLPVCIICDIDGTLAIRGDRGPYDFSKCELDEICHPVRFILDLIEDTTGVDIIILTGREDFYHEQTNNWLNKHKVPFRKLYMRRGGDHRKDAIVKKEIFDDVIRPKYNVMFVIDDRKQVKEMWVNEGLFVFDVNQSDEKF